MWRPRGGGPSSPRTPFFQALGCIMAQGIGEVGIAREQSSGNCPLGRPRNRSCDGPRSGVDSVEHDVRSLEPLTSRHLGEWGKRKGRGRLIVPRPW